MFSHSSACTARHKEDTKCYLLGRPCCLCSAEVGDRRHSGHRVWAQKCCPLPALCHGLGCEGLTMSLSAVLSAGWKHKGRKLVGHLL